MVFRFSRKTVFFLFFSLALLLSCQTAPVIAGSFQEEGDFVPLDAGASAYIFADMNYARSLLHIFPFADIGNRQTRQMIDRTETAAVAVFPEESERHFQLVMMGRYPTARSNMALRSNRQWRRQRSDYGVFWQSRLEEMSLAMSQQNFFLATWREPDTAGHPFAAAPGIQLPQGFADFKRGAAVSIWLDDPGPSIDNLFQSMGIPLQLPAESVFVSLFQAGEELYEATIRLRLATAIEAAGIASILNLARGFMMLASPGMQVAAGGAADAAAAQDAVALLTAVLFTNPPSVHGRDVEIQTAALNESEIVLLMAVFSAVLD
ncbi:MAG: hypothetical protein FWG66_02380 [Spirochaetes bacterium]|nr:hypothetical protein [Spirochaetota bacterium]